ncbi:MAG TPA: M20/M25/M40 family metallo-hydrolase [Bacteroidetes bacterium]|nr:M20/M25/M40 family metallo-hydrolase [Bacteroidota bacterium]
MKKLRRLLFRILLIGLSVMAAIFAFNTYTFPSKQIKVEPVSPMEIGDAVIERLAAAVRIPTLSYEDHIDTAAFLDLDTFLWQSYPLVDSILQRETVNGFSFILKWQGQNSRLAPILLLGHMDVVGIENGGEGWSEQPFAGIQKDGYLWGRGTLDDKLAVCGLLEAVELLLSVDYAPQRTVYLAFGHDEEVGGEHGAASIAAIFKRRNIEFDFILDEGSLVVEHALPGCEPPVALIGLTEKGYVTIGLTANVESGGHSSMPGRASAINILSESIVALRDHPSPAKIEGSVKAMFEHIGPEMNLFNKIIFANIGWTKSLLIKQMSASPSSDAMLRTTIAPTIMSSGFKDNVIPTQAQAQVNCRILPGESVETTLAYIRSVVDERVTVSLGENSQATEPAPISGTGTFGYSILQTTAREIFPDAIVAPSLVVATTDARHYIDVSENIYRFVPIKVARPQVGGIHGINEKINVEEYKNTIRFYRQLILNACK